MMNKREQELQFIQALDNKIRSANTSNNVMVAVTAQELLSDYTGSTVQVDVDPFGGTPTVVNVKLTHGARIALKSYSPNKGTKVLVNCFGNFYVVVDVIL
ncbi:hypothetical protein ABE47_21075 [Bacillus thuringiensis]|nr:hypothetical protein [Bacillus thuringiensis]PGU95945.1 hypothetical protein COD69_24945 [Bacillus thuringiensis]HEF1904294.1 hypothetical protein [Bacillus cereus]